MFMPSEVTKTGLRTHVPMKSEPSCGDTSKIFVTKKNRRRFTARAASRDASPGPRRRAGPPRTATSLRLPKKNKSRTVRLAWSGPRKRRRFGGVVVAARGASRALVASRRLRRRVAWIGRGGHLGGPGPCREADTLETV